MRIRLLLGLLLLVGQVAAEEPPNAARVFVGQTLAEAKAVFAQNKIPAMESYPFAVAVMEGTDLVAYELDEETVLSVNIDLKTSTIRSISTTYVPPHRTSKTQVVDKGVRSITFHSPSDYSVRFLRDLRSPEQRLNDFREAVKRIQDAAESSPLEAVEDTGESEKK